MSDAIDLSKLMKCMEETFVTKEELERLEDKVDGLPTKDEFYEAMDQLLGEMKGIREEMASMRYRVDNHEERIGKLEDLVLAS